MPAFGSPGFSATKQQAQQYRTASPAPAPQPALSMPAYTQASGAGAAQPIQPATSSDPGAAQPSQRAPSNPPKKPRGVIPGVGVVGGGDATKDEIFGAYRKSAAPAQSYQQRQRERTLKAMPSDQAAAQSELWALQDARDSGKDTPGSAEKMIAAQERLQSLKDNAVQAWRSAAPDQRDSMAYDDLVRTGGIAAGMPMPTREEYTGRLRGQREAEAKKQADRSAVLGKYERPSGMSDKTFGYLVDQKESGERVWSKPSYDVWRELNNRPEFKTDAKAYGNQISPGLQGIMSGDMRAYDMDTRHARDVSSFDRDRLNQAAGQYLPNNQFDWRPWENKLSLRAPAATDALIARLG